jgi:metal-responsive CopG/Arc/MetJ family transcriptional regulator
MAMVESSQVLTEPVSFREDLRILRLMDRVAKSKGTDRSAVYREAARFYLASKSHLTAEEKKDLGITPAPGTGTP